MRRAIGVLAALALGGGAAAAGAKRPQAEPAAAAAARGVEDPLAFVRGVYEAYRRGPDAAPAYPAFAYSNRLRLLFDAYEAWAAQHNDLVGSPGRPATAAGATPAHCRMRAVAMAFCVGHQRVHVGAVVDAGRGEDVGVARALAEAERLGAPRVVLAVDEQHPAGRCAGPSVSTSRIAHGLNAHRDVTRHEVARAAGSRSGCRLLPRCG